MAYYYTDDDSEHRSRNSLESTEVTSFLKNVSSNLRWVKMVSIIPSKATIPKKKEEGNEILDVAGEIL